MICVVRCRQSLLLRWCLLLLCNLACLCCFDANKPRLAIDYGPRLVGLASSDMLGCVRPYVTVKNGGDLVALSKDVVEIMRRVGAKEVVVGLPVDSNGKVGYGVKNFNGQLCLSFSRVLCAVVSDALPHVKVLLADERYTTKEAKFRLKFDDSASKKKVQASLDAMSAACLLERFIQDEGEGSIDAVACALPVPRDLQFFYYGTVRDYIRETYYDGDDHSSIGAAASSGFKSTFAANKFNLERAKGLRIGGDRRPRLKRVIRATASVIASGDDGEGRALGEVVVVAAAAVSRLDSEQDKPFWETFDRHNAADTAADNIGLGLGLGHGSMATPEAADSRTDEGDVLSGEGEAEMVEYRRLKALRRRRGTLRKKGS